MKTTLIVIQDDADHAQAKALIEKLLESKDPADQARMMAQAYLTEAYERSRWPRRTPSLPDLLTYLMDQHGLSRSDLIPLGMACRVSEVLTGSAVRPHRSSHANSDGDRRNSANEFSATIPLKAAEIQSTP